MLGVQDSIFSMMKMEKFTTFTISYDQAKDNLQFVLSKEWLEEMQWAKKNEKLFLKKPERLTTPKVKKTISDYQLEDYMGEISRLIKVGRHRRVEYLYDCRSDARSIVALHHIGKQQTVGGIRRSNHAKPEFEVITDVLNLSREMSFRCAVAGLSYGGACLGFQAPKSEEKTLDDLMGFLGYVIERYKVKWGIESGFTREEVGKLGEYASKLVTNKKQNADLISTAAAYTVYVCIKEAVRFRYGKDDLQGKLIGIQGLGRIGSHLAELLLKEQAEIIASDTDSSQIQAFLKKQTPEVKKTINTVSSTEIGMQMGHVFSPCGSSGVLSRDSIQTIGYHIIVGGANCLLKANTINEQIALADHLMKKGVLYIPDWISNVGAIVGGTDLLISENSTFESVCQKVDAICKPLVREILEESQAKGISPLEVAYKKFEAVIYQ